MATRFGRYELLGRLGVGGVGEVWAARLHGPLGFRKPVALKMLKPPVRGELATDLKREASVGVRLSHPNVVATYEHGEVDGRGFIAMELVDGPSVAALLASERLSPRAVLDIARQAAHGLAYVHAPGGEKGLVHRDIKPGNLLCDRFGVVKVSDLGIARWVAQEQDGAWVAGTPGYMPPEQCRGHEDARADQFALAVTILRLLTGRRPFGSGLQAMENVVHVESLLNGPTLLEGTEVIPGLPHVLRRCLRADPGDRFDSADDLVDALDAVPVDAIPGPSLVEIVRGQEETTRLEAPSHSASRTPARTGSGFKGTAEAFFGREAQLTTLRDHLRGGGEPVLLLGPGGVGKTRLAREAVAGVDLPQFVCDLQDARSLAGMITAIARTFRIRLGADPLKRLGAVMQQAGRAILVLDNLEQLSEHAEVLQRLIDGAGDVSVLMTSRVSLPVSALAIEVDPLSPSAATELFVARSVREIPSSERAQVRQLVERLDGLPLAVELAAARTGRLSSFELLAALEGRPQLSAAGGRPGLWASFGLSWDLLEPWEQATLAQISVFEGGCDGRAVDAIVDLSPWPNAPSPASVLETLVGHSLVRWNPGTERFSLLQTLKSFASTHLDAPEPVQVRHLRWYAQMGTSAALEARSGDPRIGRRADRELDNLVVAHDRAEGLGCAFEGERTLLAAWEIWRRRGPVQAALTRLQAASRTSTQYAMQLALAKALAATDDSIGALEVLDRADALAVARNSIPGQLESLLTRSFILKDQGELDESRRLAERVLDTSVRLGRDRMRARALHLLGAIDMHTGDRARSRVNLEAASQAARLYGPWRTHASATGMMGANLTRLGRPGEAIRYLRTAESLLRETGHVQDRVTVQVNLSIAYMDVGDWARGRRMAQRTLATARACGSRVAANAMLQALGYCSAELGEHATAMRYLDQVQKPPGERERPKELAQFHSIRAHLLECRGDLDAALLTLQLAGAAYTSYRDLPPWIVRRRGSLLLLKGQVHEARELLERSIEQYGDNPSGVACAHAWLALAWVELGDSERARSSLDQSTALLEKTGLLPESTERRALAQAQRRFVAAFPG